jgi:hypothetical protein
MGILIRHAEFYSKNVKGEGRIMFKFVLKMNSLTMWTGFVWLRILSMVSCEHAVNPCVP